MNAVVEALREGDVYRWCYREPGDDRQWGRYHCCSLRGIVRRDGRLWDTYWSSGHDGRSFGVDDLAKLDLTYLGNLSDLEKVPEWNADYYDDADIVNLNHANSTRDNFYLRKGAKRSAAKMLETARHRLKKAESDVRTATANVVRFSEVIAKIEAGETEFFF